MSDAAFDIAAGGMAVQRSAMDLIAENLAGVPAGRADAGGSSVERPAFMPASFSSALDDALALTDSSDINMPIDEDTGWNFTSASASSGDDTALANAFTPAAGVSRSGIDPIGQMIALISTGRAYDADVAALQAAKQMDVEASDIDKY